MANDPLMNGDIVGGGNAALWLGAMNGNTGNLAANSTIMADSGLNGSTGASNLGSSTNVGATNSTGLNGANLDNLTQTAIGQSFAGGNTGATTGVNSNVTSNTSRVDPNNSGLLQNAANGSAVNPMNPAAAFSPLAADNVFNNFNEADLVGSAARNPTFMPSVSDNTSFDQALNQLALSQSGLGMGA